LQPRPVEPDKLVKGMAELIGNTMGPQVEVELRLRDGLWKVLCDPNQLESALLNLAVNARDAIPEGGSFTVTTADVSLSRSDLSDQDEVGPGDYVEVAVTDTGTGMTPDVMARAFEPFFTTKPTGEGTGLGLSQVFGFVRQSGGFVRLKSQSGVGTSVSIYLPRYQKVGLDGAGTHRSNGASETGAPGDVTGKTVLVVEDEADVRAMIVEALGDLGCRVIEAEDGNAGLRIVHSAVYIDLLLTDVGLPGLNGRQLADAARERRPDLPVVLITGYAGDALRGTGPASGMGVIQKPFALDALAAGVSTLLKAKH
jgi:CheY-like chemotaxis protein